MSDKSKSGSDTQRVIAKDHQTVFARKPEPTPTTPPAQPVEKKKGD